MTGLPMTKMTLAEMHAARARGENRSDFPDAVRRAATAPPDEDAPNMAGAMRAEVKRLRGRPVGSDRTQIALRVDNATLLAFKATGKGWQSRMNEALADWLKAHSAV